MQNREISGVLELLLKTIDFRVRILKFLLYLQLAPYIHYLCTYLRSRNVKWISDIYQATSLWKLDRNG